MAGVNTPIAKQTLKLLHDYVHLGRAAVATVGGTASSLSRSLISPMSEVDLSTTTLQASNSFCDQEDLTLVDSMLNEEVALYAHDFDEEIVGDEQQPVHCISPPPGYTDNPLVGETSTGLQGDCTGAHNPCYVPSPTSSLFSASIFSELASIFEKDFQNRISGDDRTSYESSDDLANMKSVKPSTSFTSSDFGNTGGSPLFSHHKSFDAMWRPKGSSDDQAGCSTYSIDEQPQQQKQQPALSSLINSGCISDYGGEMEEERYRHSVSNAELLQMSNYSISSSTSNVMQQNQKQSTQPYQPPPKPPRKSLKNRAIDYGGHLEQAKSDFNVNYTQRQKKDRNKLSNEERKTKEIAAPEEDSEEGSNSQQINSVITKDPKKKKTIEENGVKNQNISTLAMSFDDFYKLYDQIASNSTNSPVKSIHRGTKSIDLDYEHRISQNKENTTPPPGVDMAEEDVVTVIEILKAKYAEIQPPKRHKRKKKSSTKPVSARLSTNELLNNKRDSSTATADGEVIIVADRGDGVTSGGALVEPVRPVKVGVIEKKSVAIETELRRPKPTVANRFEINGGNKPKQKSELYSAYCETLKFDQKGDKGNPFAGKFVSFFKFIVS